jgi:hypothetical protein
VRTEGAVPDGSTPRKQSVAFHSERGGKNFLNHWLFGVTREAFGLSALFSPNLPRTEPPGRPDSQNIPNTNQPIKPRHPKRNPYKSHTNLSPASPPCLGVFAFFALNGILFTQPIDL